MTTYTGVNALSAASTGEQPQELMNGAAAETIWTFALTAALAGGDLIQMQSMPANQYLTGLTLDSDALDTGGTPAIAFDVCLTSNTGTIFIKNATIPQGGGSTGLGDSSKAQAAAIGFTSTAVQQFQIKVRTSPQVGASSGTVRLRAAWTRKP